ncbi:MAG TPA: amidohydrolase family protein, partial [Candidatus Methylomirabilis sp.]|nr:amidohydrolase family protein [Candidatus Methylomirabilis sp.]
DAHCHITYGDARSEEEQDLYGSAEYRAIRAVWNAEKLLRAGYTSICDPGGSWNVGVAVRDAIRSGMFPGPRIATAGRFLTSHTGLADYYPTWIGTPPSSTGVLTNSAETIVDEIRSQVKNGVDIIKVAASGESPVLTPGGGSVPGFRRLELELVADEAHRLGRRVTAHARSGLAVIDCIAAGFDWIMHGDYMTREQADRLAESRVPLCPTLTLLANYAEWGHLVGASTTRIDRFKRNLDQAVSVLEYAHRQGVTLMCGTDSGFAITPYGEWHAREMEVFVKYLGISPLEAITCGTKHASFAVDASAVGTLEAGKWADVLVVDGDPLRDIRVLQDKACIRAVLKGGVAVDLARSRPEPNKWPWERAMVMTQGELSYATVYGRDGEGSDA